MPSNEPRDPYDGLDGLHVPVIPPPLFARAAADARLAQLREELSDLTTTADNLERLQRAGLSSETLQQIVDCGPFAAGHFAQLLGDHIAATSFGFSTAGEAELARQALQPKFRERLRDRWLCLRWRLGTWVLGFDPDEANR